MVSATKVKGKKELLEKRDKDQCDRSWGGLGYVKNPRSRRPA